MKLTLPHFDETRQRWLLLVLTFFTFFFLLGSRALNEPDEGRYSEIAREMIETGDWLVPHLWYLPHLDKPPMTYWLVAASMKIFGQNEWAVRLPIALAGISGIFATFLLGNSLGGKRVGFWSALILQSSLLYFIMARFLTTDIFLTQFVAWAMYFFWRSRICLNSEFRTPNSEFFLWHLAGWISVALGFLTKGPIALVIPVASFLILLIFRWKEVREKKLWLGGMGLGLVCFLILAAPWFLAVFQRVPQSAHFMILGQAAGHLLGTTIKNRHGSAFYFFAILAAGLLPWTILLGWLWRRNHWRSLDENSKEAWLLLSVWAIFTFVLFSLSQSKLPPYILPIFPALAILIAQKFFASEHDVSSTPKIAWQIGLSSALAPPAIYPLVIKFVFHHNLSARLQGQMVIAAVTGISLFWLASKWKRQKTAAMTVALALLGFFAVVAEIPEFETAFGWNQTLKPLGRALQENVQPADAVVCWGRLPQGLPFYSGGVISATNRPYFGGMDLMQVPFEFPGNRERLGGLLLPDGQALAELLCRQQRVWLVGFRNTVEQFQQNHEMPSLRLVTRVGQWELWVNR